MSWFHYPVIQVKFPIKIYDMSTENSYSPTWVGFPGLLTTAFIVLKLTKVIDWSWLWILSPLWIPLSFALLIGFIALAIGIYKILKK